MRNTLASTLLAVSIMLIGCGGDSYESMASDSVSYYEEMASILEGVSDVESAKAAAPKLEAVGQKMAELRKRTDALGQPTLEQVKALEEKYTKEMTSAMGRIGAVARKLAGKPEIEEILEVPMKKFRGGM